MKTMKSTNNLVEAHAIYLKDLKGYSTHTVEEYTRDIVDFVRWFREYDQDARWSKVTREVIDDYMIHMSNDMLKPATINRHISALSSLFRFFCRQGLTNTNPTKYESRPKVAQTEPNTINVNDLEKAIENADDETALALTLLYQTGVRAEELLNIRTTDIDYQNNIIRIHGKGSKDRTVFVLPQTIEMIEAWMKGGSGKLFTYNTTRDLRRDVHEALEPYSKANQLSPHAIRHTFATEMTNKGMSTITLAALLGHSNVKTTQKYVNMNGVGVQQQYLQFMS